MPRRFSVTQFERCHEPLCLGTFGSVDVKSLANTIALLKEVCDLDKEVTLRVEESLWT
jgi:hypothetical protein